MPVIAEGRNFCLRPVYHQHIFSSQAFGFEILNEEASLAIDGQHV